MRNVPGVAIYFLTLQQLQYLVIVGHQRGFPIINRLYDAEGRKLSTVGNLVAGAVARTSAGTLLLPTTVLKVRFESRQYRYNSLLEACKEIWISDGLKGFFRGLGATALRDAPHAGLYLAFYEALKESIPSDTTLGKLACGSLAGFLATATTQPFDLAKTRVQLSKERVNFITIISRVIKSEGLLGLFNGMAPRLLRKSLSSAVTWTVYEELLTWYQQNYN